MAFDINFYSNASSPKKLSKALTLAGTVSGQLVEGTSIVNPSITFELENLPVFNYIHIPAFNRYYFVKDITNVQGNFWRIDMHVDVLMTYKSSLLSCPCVCERQENASNMYLQDDRLPVSSKKFTTTKRIGTHAFTNDQYILICQ